MANRNDKTPGNVAGQFYVDSSCIDCDLCRDKAPAIFVRNDEIGLTVAARQPSDETEFLLAKAALEGCPTDSIGMDG